MKEAWTACCLVHHVFCRDPITAEGAPSFCGDKEETNDSEHYREFSPIKSHWYIMNFWFEEETSGAKTSISSPNGVIDVVTYVTQNTECTEQRSDG